MAAARKAEKLRVFISYSRRDATAADAVVAALSARGYEVAIDRRDLPFGEKWQAELAEFIRLSDTVIWLVSDASVQSNWVNWELDEVARRNKWLVPVMVAETARDTLPRQLGEIHILPAEGVIDLARDLDALVNVLETDRAWLKQASRLQDRATEWLSKGRTSALLLSRWALADAEKWKERRPAKSPAPAQEVLDLLHASRQSATRRQRWWVGGSLAVAIGALALAGFAYLQSVEAERQANEAQRQGKIAGEQRDVAEGRRRETVALRQQTQFTESGLLANAAGELVDDTLGRDAGAAMLLALEALPDKAADVDRPYVPEAEFQLDRSLWASHERALMAGHGSAVRRAAWSPDGARIVTVSADMTARVWDAASGKELARLEDHYGDVYSAAWSPDGARIVTASKDKTARVWDAVSGKELARLEGHRGEVLSAAWSPDGARIVTASTDNTAWVWEVATGKEFVRLESQGGEVLSVAWRPDGARIVTASVDMTARVWEAATGKEIARLEGFGGPVRTAAWSPDGARIVTASDDRTVRVWEAASGKELARLQGHRSLIRSAAWSPDGLRILTASLDETARVWEAATGRELARLEDHDGGVGYAAWSPDGARIATASGEAARVWEAVSGKHLARLKGHHGLLQTVGWSPDGARIITASRDMTARVWDAASSKELARLEGHTREVLSAAWSPDGTRIVAASADNTARVWDAATGKQLARLEHGDQVYSAAWSSLPPNADGAVLIITASLEGSARLWRVFASTQDLVNAAKDHVRRCLSPTQRRRYFLSDAPPLWCVERRLWPYHTEDWQAWLAARSLGREVPLPGMTAAR
jgi:WD40 repeat protein